MNEEIIVLEKQLKEMSAVFSANVGEPFRINDGDTLLILQRRMKESDLLTALIGYDAIFAKAEKTSLVDICNSAAAYIRIKVLVENESTDFNRELLGKLIREYNSHIAKVGNVIRLSRINLLAEENIERERVKKTLEKNEALQRIFQKEVEKSEKLLESMEEIHFEEKVNDKGGEDIKGTDKQEKSKNKREKSQRQKKEPKPKSKKDKESFFVNVLAGKKSQVQIERQLKGEETKKSLTLCDEVVYYEKTLAFSESMLCKDIPAYSLMKRKNQYFFGLTKNIKKSSYDNADESLLELTKTTDEFVQFMTEDVLGEEILLKPFSVEEKKSLQMYFSFMCGCFEKYMGNTLTVNEYIKFKKYFNRVVLTMFELEQKKMEQYYKALMIADRYITYMQCYNLTESDEREIIVQNIMEKKSGSYADDLGLILENHIVDSNAREELYALTEYINGFGESDNAEYDNPEHKIESSSLQYRNNTCTVDLYQMNDMQVISSEDVGYVQLKVQFQNENYETMDEATFIPDNIAQAVYDYMNRDAYVKKIGFCMNEKDVFVFAIINDGESVRLLTDEIKRQKQIDEGLIGQLVNLYEEKIEKVMKEIV